MAVDSAGDRAFAAGPGAVIFAAGSSTPTWEISPHQGISAAVYITFDDADNMYVVNATSQAGNVVEYAFGSSSPKRTITDGVNSPAQVCSDTKGNLYVLNATGPSVTEYAAGQRTVKRTIISGLDQPSAIAVDASANLYVANKGSGSNAESITIYSPSSSAPTRTNTAGVSEPIGIAVAP
jgi:hypothetical protein